MTLHVFKDLEQRSPEWYAARCGIVTASVVGRLLSSLDEGFECGDRRACAC